MKNIFNKLLFVIILSINIMFVILFLVFDKQEYSFVENRYLTDFSIDTFDEYLSDHLPFRNQLISIKNKFKHSIGNTLINGIYVSDDYLIPEFVDNDSKDIIINIINNFVSKNKNVDVMIVPDSIAFNSDKLSRKLTSNELDEIDYLYSKINANDINVCKEISNENILNDNQYYHSDHHWTTFGAYTAYKKYMDVKGETYLDIDKFDVKKVSDDFLGTSSSLAIGLGKSDDLYIFDIDNDLEVNYVFEDKNTNTLYNMDYLDTKDKYAMFLDNSHGLIKIHNNNLKKGSIIIIKNSYGNCFVPFVVNHYCDTYVIDLRYFKDNLTDFISEENIEDILILYNLNNLYSDMSIAYLK